MKTETVIFDTIVPYPAPVNIAELLSDIEGVIKRHVVLSEPAAAALAVWVLHSYTFELRDTVAYVAIESPEKRCGKTTLLSVLAAMASKSLIASNITVGARFRAIHTCTPTLFIDEADTFLAGNSIMRGIINSGNTRRTAYVLRLAASKKAGRVSRLTTAAQERSPTMGEGASAAQQHARVVQPCEPGLPSPSIPLPQWG
jgi:putative DNA primase/helicase